MTTDLANFIHSLCLAIASSTGLVYATTPRSLWRDRAVEESAASVYSVLRIYGGPAQVADGLPRVSVQVETLSKEGAAESSAVLAQSQAIFESLHASTGDARPWRMVSLTGKTVAGVDDGRWLITSIDFNQRPGIVSVDQHRTRCAFNMEIGFVKTS